MGGLLAAGSTLASAAAGDSIATAFQKSRLNSTEGITARIAELEGKNANLDATLQPGSGVGEAAQTTARDQYNANQRIIESLKAQVKNIEAVKSAYEGLGGKLAAAEGLLLGPVAKIYGELDAQKAIGVNQFTASTTSKGWARSTLPTSRLPERFKSRSKRSATTP
jgi:hypothetical protein